MTEQELFTRVARHLLTQKRKAKFSAETGCRYRVKVAASELSCAVGCLIPEDRYHPDMEGVGINGIEWDDQNEVLRLGSREIQHVDAYRRRRSFELLLPVLKEIGITSQSRLQLLKSLQWIHDDAAPDDWARHLARVASRHGLNMPEVAT